jgi:hypothetical protein
LVALPASPQRVVARKLKVLRFLRRHGPDSLAAAAGVPVAELFRPAGANGGGAFVPYRAGAALLRGLG